MFIPDPNFSITDPKVFHPGSRIRIKEIKYVNPKKWFQSSRKYDPGVHPGSEFLPIPDPGSRGQKGTDSRIPDPDPQHCMALPIY
jgi:hypothetical protein